MKRKPDMHQIENAHLRQPHFTYWIMGFKVISITPLKDYREYLVIDENDNYHIISRQGRHLALTKERSLKPKKTEKWFYDNSGRLERVEYEDSYNL